LSQQYFNNIYFRGRDAYGFLIQEEEVDEYAKFASKFAAKYSKKKATWDKWFNQKGGIDLLLKSNRKALKVLFIPINSLPKLISSENDSAGNSLRI
jgi:hypothetical protein